MTIMTEPSQRERETRTEAPPAGLSLALADANWFNTENLYREIDRESVGVLLLKCQDYVNGWRRGVYPWSRVCGLRRTGRSLWEQQLVLPSGWMKRYPRLGMRPIAGSILSWWNHQPAGRRRALVMSYPHYIYVRDLVRPDVSIYYNIDDYSLYWPRQAKAVRSLERELVRTSDLSICVSRLRADELRARIPEAAERIHHVPHGAPTRFLASHPLARPAEPPPDLARVPRPHIGFIGSLEDRVDWELMDRTAASFPDCSVIMVGRVKTAVNEPWWDACARFLSRPNVHAVGWRSQDELARYYQAFDVSVIPYVIDHPFNQACNPTKIMDAMGSGRPIVATAIPECRLHADRFDVAATPEEFVAAIARILAAGSDDGRAALRFEFAQANTCRAVGGHILDLIDGVAAVSRC